MSSVDGLRDVLAAAALAAVGIARCDSMANRLAELFWWASSRPLRLFGSGGRPGNDILRNGWDGERDMLIGKLLVHAKFMVLV